MWVYMKTILLLLGLVVSAFGNDTSLHDGRFGPVPFDVAMGGESPVRMVEEHIEVGFGYQFSDVHCTFTFQNTTKEKVVQLVGFPDVGAAVDEVVRRERDKEYASVIGERVNTSVIKGMVTRVDGEVVKAKLRFGEVKPGENGDGTTVWDFYGKRGVRAWYVMEVNFPPGKAVKVERTYRVKNGASALGVAFFEYTTATGGVWKGTIGRLQVDVTLRDEGMKVKDLVWPGTKLNDVDTLEGELVRFATQPGRSAWKVVDDTHLRLVWRDFEPRTEKNHRGFSLSRRFHGFDPTEK